MRHFTGLLFAVILVAAAVPSQAAFDAYVRITGTKQGQFKGAGRSKTNNLPAVHVVQPIVSPRDPQSGLSTGKRNHKPMVMVFESADVVELQKALVTHEELSSVVISMVVPAGNGKVRHTKTITLTNASVVSLKQQGGHSAGGGGGAGKVSMEELVEVAFQFQKITYGMGDASVRSADDWKS